jgi:hypothetical protein
MLINRGWLAGWCALIVLVFSGQVYAALHVRGLGTITGGGVGKYLLIYDDVLDITWLDFTNPSGSWHDQMAWADSLEVTLSGETYDDWRLPRTLPVNGTEYDYSTSVDGSTDYGLNISAPGSAHPGSTGSEMAHLYYTTLGNLSTTDIWGNPIESGWGLENTGPFTYLNGGSEYDIYFSETESCVFLPSPGTHSTFSFSFNNGTQYCGQTLDSHYAIAVRSGNVAFEPLPDPEPETALLNQWVKRTNADIPTHSKLNDITYGNEIFVAVGLTGTIVSSADGVNWVERVPNDTKNHYSTVTYGNGIFIALGSDIIRISSDGITWSDPGTYPGKMGDVIFSDGRFVAVGDGIFSSEDGITWRHDSWVGGFGAVAYGDGIFVAVGGYEIFTSVDGINWVDRSLGINVPLKDVAYGGGRFVIAGNDRFLYSDDGVLWFSSGQDIGNEIFGITYGDNQFVAVAKNMACVSTDGIQWTTHFTPIQYTWAAIYANGMFWAVGDEGAISNSPDGKNWTIRSNFTQDYETLTDICFGNGKYVAVGYYGLLLASDDGRVWTSIDWTDGDYQLFQRGTTIYQILFRNGAFLALGFYSQPGGGDHYPITLASTNGVDWDIHSISFFPSVLYQMVASEDLLVAVGYNGQIATSVDGVAWTARDSQTGSTLWGITYANGMFVAVGSNDTMVTSTDGIQWTQKNLGKSKHFGSIAYGNGVFVLFPTSMYEHYTYYTSTDGNNWEAHVEQIDDRQFYSYQVRFLNGRFFACNQYYPSLFSSPDGINWTNHDIKTPGNQLNSISYYNNAYLALGVGLTVLKSENGTDWTILRYPCSTEIKSVVYGNGTFIATGGGGYWRSSHDPQWSSSTINLGTGDVAYGNGRFVSSVAYSEDGLSWTNTLSGIQVRNITFGNGVFVGSAYVGIDTEQFYTSSDGVEWIPANGGTVDPVNDITFAKDRFFAKIAHFAEGYLVSFDGMNWGTIGTGVSFASIAYGNNMFLACSGNELYRSFDSYNWTKSYSHPNPTIGFSRIGYGAGKFLIADSQGQFYSTPYGIILDQHYNSRTVINDMAFGNGTFVAVGHNGTIIQSIGDTDEDGLMDPLEDSICTDTYDADTDDDGILDGDEDANHDGNVSAGETDPCLNDTDGDGIQDGTEIGLMLSDVGQDTDIGVFIPDADPSTTTDPQDADSDNDGVSDGEEDANFNGAVDGEESDPNISDRPKAMPWIPLLLMD